jgi:hypothetical protein
VKHVAVALALLALFFVLSNGSPLALKNTAQASGHNNHAADHKNEPDPPMALKELEKDNREKGDSVAEKGHGVTSKSGFDYVLWGFRLNLVLLGVTLIIAVAGLVQAIAAKQNAKTAELALRLSERADVLLDGAGFTPDGEITGESAVCLIFKNFGRTRAANVAFATRLIIPNTPDVQPPESSPMVVGAGNTQPALFHKFSSWLTKETFRGIMDGSVSLEFRSQVRYTDVFDIPHTTSCGGRFDHATKAFIVGQNEAD